MARNLLALPVVCLLALAVGFVSADEPEKIVGGSNALLGEFPFAVSIQVFGNHFCGGAIISETHILTAAHCLEQFKGAAKILTVRTGTIDTRNGGSTYKVDDIFPHPEYDDDNMWFNDIGLVKLATPIKFNRFQHKIALPTSAPIVDSEPVIAGWGNTSPLSRTPTNLQKIHLRIIDRKLCEAYHKGVEIFSSMICTLTRAGEGTCNGDSGGPLVYEGEIIGVVSGGIPCAVGFPDVFTNVYEHLRFIHTYMQY